MAFSPVIRFQGASRVKAHRNIIGEVIGLDFGVFQGASRVKAHRNGPGEAQLRRGRGSKEPRASKRIETGG